VNTSRWLLAVLLALGAALRIHGLTDHELWIDEYGTWWAIAGDGWGDCWRRVLEIHGQSPFYYLLTRLCVDLFGLGTASLRLPSLAAGLGLLALAYPLALRIFRDRHVALLCVAALAVDDRLIYYSQEARPYALALLCAAGSFHCYALLLDHGGRGARLAYVASAALTWYAHYLFGVVVAAQVLHLVLQRPWTAGRGRAWLGTLALLGAAMAPGLAQLSSLFRRRETVDWIAPTGLLASLKPAVELVDPLILVSVGGLVLLAGSRQDLAGLPRGSRPGIVLLWLAVPCLVFTAITAAFGVSLLHARYLVVAAPAVPLLYGALLAMPRGGRLLRTLPLVAYAGLVVGMQLAPLVRRDGGPFWWFLHHGWESATRELVRGYRDGDLILYRTGFVELDDVVRGRASPATIEFVEWPFLAHLPKDREFHRRALPYSDTPELRVRLAPTLAEARAASRVWVIGLHPQDPRGQPVVGLLEMAVEGRAREWLVNSHYGVNLFLVREPAAPREGGRRTRPRRPARASGVTAPSASRPRIPADGRRDARARAAPRRPARPSRSGRAPRT
jgi:hypothetical protein